MECKIIGNSAVSYQECVNLCIMYAAKHSINLEVFADESWKESVDKSLVAGSRLTHAVSYLVRDAKRVDSLQDLCALCADAPVASSSECGDLTAAMTASTREDLEDTLESSTDVDARVVAQWRLEFDICVGPMIPKRLCSKALSITVDRKVISKLITIYEMEAQESMDALADRTKFSDMVYHRCTSPLFWGLMRARDVESMTLEDLLLWSVVPKQVPKCVSNTDKGYEWFLEALTAEKAVDFSEYLLVNWEDYRSEVTETTNPFLAIPLLVSGMHPIHPDSYLIARWRLENGLFL